MNGRRPHYDLNEIKGFVKEGSYRTTRRVSGTLKNHGYTSATDVARGVFEAMSAEHFYKCDELNNIPGTLADIYKGVPWDGAEWYVKFFKREDGSTTVDIWSLKDNGWM